MLRPSMKRTVGWSYPCSVCHENFPVEHSNQQICSAACKRVRMNENNRKCYAAHKEQRRQTKEKYYYNNREKIIKKQTAYVLRNLEHIKEKRRLYYLAHRETHREVMRQYYLKNRERLLTKKPTLSEAN